MGKHKNKFYLMSTLTKRIFSAITLILILVICFFFWKQKGLLFFGFLFILIGVLEYYSLNIKPLSSSIFLFSWFLLFFLSSLGFILYKNSLSFPLWLLFFVFFSSGVLWISQGKMDNKTLWTLLANAGWGGVYLSLLPASCLLLLTFPHPHWFFLLLLTTFLGDTLAYFTGRFWGKTPLMPEVSPSKTLEGSLGGLIGSLVGALCYIPFLHFSWDKAFLLGIGVAFLGQSGDLVASLLKRQAHVKDSGNLLPGHGGILDRIDGVLFAGPFVFVVANYLQSH
ncbi:MAG: hypothetical protein D6797_09610 [Bdellovibrio sp.]|nr:MAG: hypothetical protein D6797_09610 [Bdellovibrio sp.]